jgi:hypothetical protein
MIHWYLGRRWCGGDQRVPLSILPQSPRASKPLNPGIPTSQTKPTSPKQQTQIWQQPPDSDLSRAPIPQHHPIAPVPTSIPPANPIAPTRKRQLPSIDTTQLRRLSISDCALPPGLRITMLAFKVESWIWYGLVLFIAFSRLYVPMAFSLHAPSGCTALMLFRAKCITANGSRIFREIRSR